MWGFLAEWCGDLWSTTNRRRPAWLLTTVLLGAVLTIQWGWSGFWPSFTLLGFASLLAYTVSHERERVWQTARLPLGDPRQFPTERAEDKFTAPSVAALRRLARAVNAVRCNRYVDAHELVPRIDRVLLRPDELQLLDAVRAMISLGLGDDERAAQQAVLAVPTGSDELDACLGRTIIAHAWSSPERLQAIDSAWHDKGVSPTDPSALGRLRSLVRLRVFQFPLSEVPPLEARVLADEARAIGDEDLATDLAVLARTSSGYR